MIDDRAPGAPSILVEEKAHTIQYPEVLNYDCVAETVVIVYRLSLAALGHVIYSLAGHVLQTGAEDKESDGSPIIYHNRARQREHMPRSTFSNGEDSRRRLPHANPVASPRALKEDLESLVLDTNVGMKDRATARRSGGWGLRDYHSAVSASLGDPDLQSSPSKRSFGVTRRRSEAREALEGIAQKYGGANRILGRSVARKGDNLSRSIIIGLADGGSETSIVYCIPIVGRKGSFQNFSRSFVLSFILICRALVILKYALKNRGIAKLYRRRRIINIR